MKKKIIRITESQLKKIIEETILKKQINESFGNRETDRFLQMVKSLGYEEIIDFLDDNPGAIESLEQWVYNVPEFREILDDEEIF